MKFDPRTYEKVVKEYKEEWQLLDDTLFRLCREHPDHTLPSLHAKLWVIGRTYATGIERLVTKKDTPFANEQGGSLLRVTDCLCKNRETLDALFAELRENAKAFDPQSLKSVVAIHGRFVTLLANVARDGCSLRTFASKYMHFHNQAVPIYDSVARERLWKLDGVANPSKSIERPKGADEEYFDYVVRFHQLYDLIESRKLPLEVKYVDKYLLALASGN
jgi:hypothetical protein